MMHGITIGPSTFRLPATCSLTRLFCLCFLNIFYKHVHEGYPLWTGLVANGVAASFIFQALACVKLAGAADVQQGTQWSILFSLPPGKGMSFMSLTPRVRVALLVLSVNSLHAVPERGILVILHLEEIRERGKGYPSLSLFNSVGMRKLSVQKLELTSCNPPDPS